MGKVSRRSLMTAGKETETLNSLVLDAGKEGPKKDWTVSQCARISSVKEMGPLSSRMARVFIKEEPPVGSANDHLYIHCCSFCPATYLIDKSTEEEAVISSCLVIPTDFFFKSLISQHSSRRRRIYRACAKQNWPFCFFGVPASDLLCTDVTPLPAAANIRKANFGGEYLCDVCWPSLAFVALHCVPVYATVGPTSRRRGQIQYLEMTASISPCLTTPKLFPFFTTFPSWLAGWMAGCAT